MEFISKNEMSLTNLVREQGATVSTYVNKQGKNFFVCGNVTGYCSQAAAEVLEDSNLSDAEAFSKVRFAEVSNDGGTKYVPCLMIVGTKSANSTRGASILATL